MNIFRFLLSLILLISFNGYLVAQEAEEEESVEEVVVTGSRIATSEFEGAQPVLVIDQEDIQKTGEMTISDVLRETPINTCLLYTSPSPRDAHESRMPSSA